MNRLESVERLRIARELVRLHRDEKSGVLNCLNREMFKKILFANGFVVAVQSNEPHDLLGSRLLDQGRITLAQRDAALRTQAGLGMRLGSVLLRNQVLDEPALISELVSQAGAVLQSILGWERGRFEFEERTIDLPLRHPLWLDPREAVFRFRLEDPTVDVLPLDPDGRVTTKERGAVPAWVVGEELHAVLRAARQEPTFREMAELLRVGWEKLAHWLGALELVGLVELGRRSGPAGRGSAGPADPIQALLDQADRLVREGAQWEAVEALEKAVRKGLPLAQILDRLARISRSLSIS